MESATRNASAGEEAVTVSVIRFVSSMLAAVIVPSKSVHPSSFRTVLRRTELFTTSENTTARFAVVDILLNTDVLLPLSDTTNVALQEYTGVYVWVVTTNAAMAANTAVRRITNHLLIIALITRM